MIKNIVVISVFLISSIYSQNIVDGIAAIVGKEIILKSEIEQHVQNYILQNRINVQNQPQIVDKLRKETMQSLIESKLMLDIAERDTITVDPEMVDQQLDQRIQYLIEKVGSQDELEKTFKSSMKKIKKDTRKILKEQLLVDKVRQQKFMQIKTSKREVEEFYKMNADSLPVLKESVDISHILKTVKPSESAQELALKKISEIKKKIDDGASFEELAKLYSEDPASAKRGGDLGLTSRGDFVPEYEEAAFALEDGEVSDIVQTQFGYHIIQMIERRGEKINTRHILIRVTPSAEDEQRTIQELADLKARAIAGENFNDLAVKYSEDNNVKDDRGFLGTFEVDNLVLPQFKEVLKTLKEGEISDPFKTDFGYHIIKLEKRSSSRSLTLEDDWQKIEQMANNFKIEKEYRKWIDELKAQIPIEIKS